jgi:hypothetical protein
MTCAPNDIEMDLDARVIIGDWRCENGHVQRIVGVIHVGGELDAGTTDLGWGAEDV